MEILPIILSTLALSFSFYTFFAHDRRLKKQERLLNDYQLRLLDQSEKDSKKAVIRAKAVKYTRGKRTLYICNIGKTEAKNLKVDLPNPDEVYSSNPKFPLLYERLLPEASREVQLFLTEGNDELDLIYEWEDDYSVKNRESQTIDL